jgi:hypothetical protein
MESELANLNAELLRLLKLGMFFFLLQLSAVVDGVYSEHSHTAGTFSMLSSSRVYVGGSQNTHALPGSRIHNNFVGCLRKVLWNFYSLTLLLLAFFTQSCVDPRLPNLTNFGTYYPIKLTSIKLTVRIFGLRTRNPNFLSWRILQKDRDCLYRLVPTKYVFPENGDRI